MAEQVYLLVELTIDASNLETFRRIAQEMILGSRAEAGTLGYEWYFSSDDRHCRLLETYRSAEALLSHFK